jgi:hypothetical protein
MKRRITRSKAALGIVEVEEEEKPEENNSVDDNNTVVRSTSNYNQPKRPRINVEEKPYKIVKISTIYHSQEHATKKNDCFYLGTYPLKFRQISKIESIEDRNNIEDVNIYEKRFKKVYNRQLTAPSTFYLDFNQDLNEEDNLIYEIENDYLFKCINDLNVKKCIFYVKNQIDIETRTINVDSYFTPILNLNLNDHSPSEIFK